MVLRSSPVAAAIASISGVIGLYVSYYLGIASGAAIVLTCTVIFGLVWGLQAIHHRITIQAT